MLNIKWRWISLPTLVTFLKDNRSVIIKKKAVQISIQLELREGQFLAIHLFTDYFCVAKLPSPPWVQYSHGWIYHNGAGAWLRSLRLACNFLYFIEIVPTRKESRIRAWPPPVTCLDSTVRESALDL